MARPPFIAAALSLHVSISGDCVTKPNVDIYFREELHLVRHLTDCNKARGENIFDVLNGV